VITRTIEYLNLDEESVQEEHTFHLTAAEAVRMNFDKKGGVEAYARKIVETEEYGELVDLFQDLILKTYGRRVGQEFVKDEGWTNSFVNTGAYSALFIELATNAESAIQFFKGILPKNLQGNVDEAVNLDKRAYTDAELLEVSWDEFYQAAGGKNERKWDQKFLILAYQRKNAA
jgi:hypothetical protein